MMSEPDDEYNKAYEERLRRRLKILQEQIKEGKIKIAEGLNVEDSLMAVRAGPDGEIDLSTVDGLVRSMALAVTMMHDREELKNSISLSEIQNAYFTFIERGFGQFYKEMKRSGLTPHDLGIALSRSPEVIGDITKWLAEFLDTVKEFWDHTSDAAHAHIEDMHSNLKGVFGGDLFPAHNENIASKCGIYTDTIILPDPFMRSLELFDRWEPENKAYYFVKHALNILQYKDLACANLEIPIVAILPDKSSMDDNEKAFFFKLGQDDALLHARKLFGRNFESFEDLMEFAGRLDTIERVTAELSDPARVLFDTEWEGNTADQIKRASQGQQAKLLGTNHPGIIVVSHSLGRMSVSNELLVKSRRLRGIPIIDAATSWRYFSWKLEYDAKNAEDDIHVADLHVVRGLQNLSENDMEWLGKIPSDALIELRNVGALDEIREILGRGVKELVHVNPKNFHRTSDEVFDNITRAFESHKQNISKLKDKKWKFAGTEIAAWIAVGTLEVTAAATGMPVWGLAAIAADQLLDVPKLKDIPQSIRNLARESRELNESPIGMLFSYGK